MIIVSSREFRQNQRLYFDKVDQGEKVIVQRGNDKSCALSAVSEDDVYFTAEMLARLKDSLEEAQKGNYLEINSDEEVRKLLGL